MKEMVVDCCSESAFEIRLRFERTPEGVGPKRACRDAQEGGQRTEDEESTLQNSPFWPRGQNHQDPPLKRCVILAQPGDPMR